MTELYEEDDLVKEENIDEEKCEILVEKPLQQCEAEKPKAPLHYVAIPFKKLH